MGIESAVSEIRIVSSPESLPDGQYEGVWSGYLVKLSAYGSQMEAKTADGIRGINVPCVLTVLNGKMSVKVK